MARARTTKLGKANSLDDSTALKKYLETVQRYNDEKSVRELINDAIGAGDHRPIVIGPIPIPLPVAALKQFQKDIDRRIKSLKQIDAVIQKSLPRR